MSKTGKMAMLASLQPEMALEALKKKKSKMFLFGCGEGKLTLTLSIALSRRDRHSEHNHAQSLRVHVVAKGNWENWHLELFRQILLEPRMVSDPSDVDAVGRVPNKYFADEVHTLSGQVQVAGEAVLHSHDPLQELSMQLRCRISACWKHKNNTA